MKAYQVVVLLVLAGVIVWLVRGACSSHAERQTSVSRERMIVMASKVADHVDAYQREHHSYPPSLDSLGLTNGQDGIINLADVQKLQYEPTATGFRLSYKMGTSTAEIERKSP